MPKRKTHSRFLRDWARLLVPLLFIGVIIKATKPRPQELHEAHQVPPAMWCQPKALRQEQGRNPTAVVSSASAAALLNIPPELCPNDGGR